ncbi:hypothetical protein LHFGNBLO_004698 [Mesorhizobium sp. AR10]|uniref:hypothetical protein n=1 Tax=Mesorhizobium sp. AR10 TaxID=2865839 RepID=UPI00215F41F1|nr:hypothetical protein [Mesorhizobium sp. AR10]UVK37633.1 hypothetical protein LHFGNBLO_004698 [Mesorhizobium sp. AR10]
MTDDKKPIWTKFSFEQSINSLLKYGPTIRIEIGGIDLSSPKLSVLAQIDTGAAGCGISARIAKLLALKPIDVGQIHEAGREPITASIFAVRLYTPAMDMELDVAALTSLADPHDVLIGRDLLARFRIAVDFTTGLTQLHFRNDL